jgi:hypothetical protein
MKYSWIFRIVGVCILVIGIAAVGYFAYTAGFAQAQTAAPVTAESENLASWHTGGGFHLLRGLALFPFLICLAPFFLCLFIFLPLRMIFGMPRMMYGPPWMHMRMHGRCHDREGEVPSPFEEWHRHMHQEKKKDE